MLFGAEGTDFLIGFLQLSKKWVREAVIYVVKRQGIVRRSSGFRFRIPRRAGCVVLLISLIGVTLYGRGLGSRKVHGTIASSRPYGVMPGEFEPQEALLLAWPLPVLPQFPYCRTQDSEVDRVLCNIVRALGKEVRIVVPAVKECARDRIARLLAESNLAEGSIEFVPVPANDQWVRDYGPACLRSPQGSLAYIDADHFCAGLVNMHPQEDRFAKALGDCFGIKVIHAPIAIQHGNLLSNGRGLYLTTQELLLDNHGHGYHESEVAQVLRTYYGAEHLAVLELMKGELTGHVDMFATFTSPDTVVVGQYAVEVDPVNAAILDRNAERLASLELPYGPLRVVRIPMPIRPQLEDGTELWPTYTNVIFGNRKLLMPIYPGLDPAAESTARQVFESLLPDREIVCIDASPLLPGGGSLHCATMNLVSMGYHAP